MGTNTENIDIAIIMCTFKRVHRLQGTIELLKQQTLRDFHFYIWNNNSDNKSDINKTVNNNLDIVKEVTHSEENVGGVGRFILAKRIARLYTKIIFIDDDQDFKPELVELMDNTFSKNTVNCWWGWKMGGCSYMHRYRLTGTSKEVDYCGTGGMIIDSDIFKTIDLTSLPDKYKFIEDLWLSFIARYNYDYKLYGREFPIWCIDDQKDQWMGLHSSGLKDEFYRVLRGQYE
jgi:glycosyltransferase involved in cell wall biosynthesis